MSLARLALILWTAALFSAGRADAAGPEEGSFKKLFAHELDWQVYQRLSQDPAKAPLKTGFDNDWSRYADNPLEEKGRPAFVETWRKKFQSLAAEYMATDEMTDSKRAEWQKYVDLPPPTPIELMVSGKQALEMAGLQKPPEVAPPDGGAAKAAARGPVLAERPKPAPGFSVDTPPTPGEDKGEKSKTPQLRIKLYESIRNWGVWVGTGFIFGAVMNSGMGGALVLGMPWLLAGVLAGCALGLLVKATTKD